ncbi:MAG: L-seryl-tRNA(Sec) selenium transferase [Polyangiaceae bacterium]
MKGRSNSGLSGMPRVDRVVQIVEATASSTLGRTALTDLVRATLSELRAACLEHGAAVPDEQAVAEAVLARARELRAQSAARVINATGVLLHTNLGRAPLSAGATRALAETAGGYSSIELDLGTGKRGRRAAAVEQMLAALTKTEAALVVNNCAAAVLLLLASVARGRSVIVSRGELVEIGGGFRVPDVMLESGARLVEVGTTNRTHLDDYARALDATPDAAAILRVHRGNFLQIGFVEQPPLSALASLARERGVSLLKDLGGGALVDLGRVGFAGEPTVEGCVRAGCSAVVFSTDKALGGPQGGALVGSAALVDRARRHPLARALRLGRLPIVALEATLTSYRSERAWLEIPILRMAGTPLDELEARAASWVRALDGRSPASLSIVPTEAAFGGGTLAGRTAPSVALAIDVSSALGAGGADALAEALRTGAPSVMAMVVSSRVMLDARTVSPDEDDALIAATRRALATAFSQQGKIEVS